MNINKSHLEKESPNAPEIALRIFVCILIVVFGLLAFVIFNKTKPKIKKSRPEKLPPSVEVMKAEVNSHRIFVSALGTVIPEKEIEIKSLSNGEIIMTSKEFLPGGKFKKGDVILKIDPADYLLEVKRMKSLLSSAKASYDIEMGYQDVAREELTLMETATGKKVEENDLALRKPQLDQAKAQLETAKVNLDVAKLNYKRTIIKAPFNGMIQSRSVNMGMQVSQQTRLAVFTGTDNYWVEASVPVKSLKWIEIPDSEKDTGSSVEITTVESQGNSQQFFIGKVIRLTGSLTEQSRMATLLIRVPDPLKRLENGQNSPLILGSYVSLKIEGINAENVIKLPRSALRDDETVWVLKDEKLKILAVDIMWKDADSIFISNGIEKGDSVIVSNLSSPIDGMKLTDQDAVKTIRDRRKEKTGNNKE